MSEKSLINVIVTQCKPEDAEAFNTWYNGIHIPMLLKSKGVKGVTRYKTSDAETPSFIAVYRYNSPQDLEEFQKSPNTAAAIKDFEETWGGKVQLVSRTQYELIQDW